MSEPVRNPKSGEDHYQGLVTKWREYAAEDPDECKWCNGYAHGLTLAADELAEVIARKSSNLTAYQKFQCELLRDLGWGDIVEKAILSAKGKPGV